MFQLLSLVGLLLLGEGERSFRVSMSHDQACDNFSDLDLSHCLLGTRLYVRLLLYTRSNPRCGRELRHRRPFSEPLLDLSRPSAFVIHGYRPTGAPPDWIDRLVRLLAEEEDLNVIVVDWNHGAANLNYFTAEEGASLGAVHLVGVSLGAHLAGFVGANLKGKIGRITGLDPAGPMFTSATPAERLDPSDAMFVDVLHTDMDAFGDFLDGRCLQCEAFKPAPCPVLGYNMSRWKDTLLQLGQTKAYFSTTAALPYRKASYRVDMVTWNQHLRWGAVHLRLHNGRHYTETRLDHKLIPFEQYTSTRLLAQFEEDVHPVQKVSLRVSIRNVMGPRYKIRLLSIRLTPLDRPERSVMCRYDIIMEENMDVMFRPLPCVSHL
ncbi:hypothetical protein NHX12_021918 [Muraenolepis orangiensis]|uniref:Lipase domain-containing protein n=1 Tax=Muraenolepis orangiensis TaxID=630683 RepID=A0A9Q0IVJ9_9TELE|nr:hypothetical protein NHX12_021918 [Muraenolepis orangiensis]